MTIHSASLRKVSVYEDFPIKELSNQETKNFEKLYQILDHSRNKQELRIVYRGETKERLSEKMDEEYGTYNFFNRLFLIGEKAKIYSEQSQVTLKECTIQSISDVSESTFKLIFNKFNSKIKEENFTNLHINFVESHHEMISYFSNLGNIDDFMQKVSLLNTIENKIQVRDYYLYLLHNLNSDKDSLFVSTTFDKDVAISFSNSRGVIFYYLLPEPIYYYGVSVLSNHIGNNVCKNVQLPIYKDNFYPYEKEVAIKGALFPHFILGLWDIENEVFIVNPHVFKQNKNHISHIPSKGFIIDQTLFEEEINKTGYAGYVIRWANNTYSDVFSSYNIS